MPGRAENKVCVVTGASQGIGLADAKVLIAEGAKVILTDVDTERGELAAKTLGSNALFVQHDVTNEQGWIRVFEQAVNEYGKVDVLVNNAGILKPGSIVDNTIKDFRLVNAVNCEGVFLGCKHAIPVMEKSGNGGSIINMSSVAALMGISSCVAYCASKGAVRSMTKAIAAYCREQKNGIRCNSVHPGGVRTEMVTKVALGREDVSKPWSRRALMTKIEFCIILIGTPALCNNKDASTCDAIRLASCCKLMPFSTTFLLERCNAV